MALQFSDSKYIQNLTEYAFKTDQSLIATLKVNLFQGDFASKGDVLYIPNFHYDTVAQNPKVLAAVRQKIGDALYEKVKDQGISKENFSTLLNVKGAGYNATPGNLTTSSIANDENGVSILQNIVSEAQITPEGKQVVSKIAYDKFETQWKETFGTTEGAENIWKDNNFGTDIISNTYDRWDESFKGIASDYKGNVQGKIRGTYEQAYYDATGEKATEEQVQAFLDDYSIPKDFVKAYSIQDPDDRRAAVNKANKNITNSIMPPTVAEGEEPPETPSWQVTKEQVDKVTDEKGYTVDEMRTRIDADVKDFTDASMGYIDEEYKGVTEALTEYANTIPENETELRGILEERFDREATKLPETLGEEFTSGVGLRSGAFQKTFAGELAEGKTELESYLSQYSLGRKEDVASKKLAIDSGYASGKAGIETTGAQLKLDSFNYATRSEFDRARDLAYQKSLLDAKTMSDAYLNRLGFQGQLDYLREQQSGNIQLAGMQGGMAMQEGAANRANQRYIANLSSALQPSRGGGNQLLTGALAGADLGWKIGGGYGAGVGAFAGGLVGYFS